MNGIMKRFVLGIAVAAVLAITVSALAAKPRTEASAGLANPLGGIAAVDHSATAIDAVDATTSAWLSQTDAAGRAPQIGSHQLTDARQLGALPDGRPVYLVPTTMDRLCVVAAKMAESCGYPLSQKRPITLTIVDSDGSGGTGPIAYGAAEDGVASVTLTVAGADIRIPVRDNMFVLRGSADEVSSDFTGAAASFADGTTVVPN